MRCTHPARRSGTARSLTPFLLEQHPDPASNAAQRTTRAPRPAPSPNLQEEKSLPVTSTGLARLCHGGPIPTPEACHGAGRPALGLASPLPEAHPSAEEQGSSEGGPSTASRGVSALREGVLTQVLWREK